MVRFCQFISPWNPSGLFLNLFPWYKLMGVMDTTMVRNLLPGEARSIKKSIYHWKIGGTELIGMKPYIVIYLPSGKFGYCSVYIKESEYSAESINSLKDIILPEAQDVGGMDLC